MIETVYAYREFLNKPGYHSSAFIDAVMFRSDDGGYYENPYSSARLTFADCSRKIDMSIDLGDSAIDNTLYKLDTMIAGLRGLRKHVAAYKRTQYGRKRS